MTFEQALNLAIPVFPFDIFEYIVDELSWSSDFSTLSHLSLTNTFLLRPCRKALFRTLTIKPKSWDDKPLERFIPIYSKNPTITSYTHELVLWIDMHDHSSLVRASSLLHSRRLRNVETFSFAFTEELSFGSVRKEMSTLPDEFTAALCKFITANPIRQLDLHQINDVPVTLFGLVPQLQELFLYDIGLADTPPVSKTAKKHTQGVPQLKKLRVKCNIAGALSKMLKSPIIDLSQLEDLSVHLEEEYGKVPIGRLCAIPKKLKRMSIGGSSPQLYRAKGFVENFDKRALWTLTSLTFSILILTEGQDPFINIIDELRSIARRNVLTDLKIVLTIDWDIRCSISSQIWGRLEDVLVLEDSFPALERLDMEITITQLHSRDHIAFKMRLEEIGQKQFARLAERVDFTFGVDVTVVEQVE